MYSIISVVIPTYNRENTIARAIISVLNQTYKNWELFIVDDGSTDNTKEVVQKRYGADSRINYIERPSTRSKGANACRNIGIEKAKGKYVAMLDSDDEWKPQHLRNCLEVARTSKKFHGCYAGFIIERGKYEFTKKSRKVLPEESYLDFLSGSGCAPTPSYFLDRDCALSIEFDENLQRHQDWDFFIRFGEKYSWIFNKSLDVVVHWGMTQSGRNIDFDSCIVFFQKHKHKFTTPRKKIDYLYGMYREAVIKNNNEAICFYRKNLKKLGQNNFALSYPAIFRQYEFIKSKLGIFKLKKIIRHYGNNFLTKWN